MEKNAALKTLSQMQEACPEKTGVGNLWHENGADYVLEVSPRQHADGAITGTIIRLGDPTADGHRQNRLVGTIRIEGNGTVTRAHRFLMEAAEKLKAQRVAPAQPKTYAKVQAKVDAKPQKAGVVRDKKWLKMMQARAAHARTVKAEKLKAAAQTAEKAKERTPDELAIMRGRMAYARQVKLDRLAAQKQVKVN